MQNFRTSAGVISQPDSIPLVYLSRLMEVMLEHGKDAGPYLEEASISLPQLVDPNDAISKKSYDALLERCLNNIDIPALGLKVGRKNSLLDFGVLGYATLSCETLLQGLQMFFRYQSITGADSLYEETFDVDEEMMSINIRCHQPPGKLYRYCTEVALGEWVSNATNINMEGKQVHFSRVDVTYARPDYAELYEEALHCPIFYEQPENKIYFPAEYLNMRMNFSAAGSVQADFYEQQCQAVLKHLKQQSGLVEQVRRLLVQQPSRLQNPELVAKQLNMSYRTLRRRLGEEGTTFKEISNEIRMGMASECLLQTELSIQEIAYLLAYSDVTSFQRAFKKWSQQTPGEFREAGCNP
ncbi:ornithine utilization transcriptional regulator OruR [Maricurvus nonylphenolicus]|uniref:AraC family transcriptional regulator n=1 Tax=Maricurvus nonylphenolicus TaxID=1008307 RepID=UPI0036F43DD1